MDWDPDAETKVVAAMLYPYTHLPEHRIQERVAAMSEEERLAVVRAYAGDRTNRRHRPGRALERGDYRFDVALRLRRLPGPATPPAAHRGMAGPDPGPRLHHAPAP